MAEKKRTASSARAYVDEKLFPSATQPVRKKIALDNVDETLKHTKALLERARLRRRGLR